MSHTITQYEINYRQQAASPIVAIPAPEETVLLLQIKAALMADQIKYYEEFIPNPKLVSYDFVWLGKGEELPYPDIGQPAPDFEIPDTEGKLVKLSSFRGRYVLLDFWASWCGPCPAENPNLIKIYNKFKDQNFTIIGVSLDKSDSKAAWLAAIKSDGLPWLQLSDGKFWDSPAAKLYGVQAIPQNFLIDPNGVIVGKTLMGKVLDIKLAEFFK